MDTIPQHKIDNAYLELPEANWHSPMIIEVPIMEDLEVRAYDPNEIPSESTVKYKRILFEKRMFADKTYKYFLKT